ncbi:MAG: DUF805 domain-containing protein [Alphaproteobacteria bacterium]|nr:DUF805 domain-containing protein [Alphaproteobacteria bacterium]
MIGELLFNPNGRIARNRFWQGLVILTVASILVAAATTAVHEMVGLINYVLVFCYICVFGKRLHDSGRSAWWVLAIGGGTVVLQTVMTLIFLMLIWPGFMNEEQRQVWTEVLDLAQAGNSAEMTRGVQYLFEISMSTLQRAQMVITVITNAIFGYWIGTLRTVPGDNQYGPEPTG